MHKCLYSTKLKWDSRNHFFFEMTAHWKNKKATVLRRFESGVITGRYGYYSCYAGWCICFPGENMNFYQGYGIQEEEVFSVYKGTIGFFTPWTDVENDLKAIAAKRPELKYLCQKFKGSELVEFIKMVATYKQHPEIEPMVQLGLNRICFNKMFWKLKDETRKKLCSWIRVHVNELHEASEIKYSWFYNVDEIPFSLIDLLKYMKSNKPLIEQVKWDVYKVDEKQYRYITNKNVEPCDYNNYLNQVKMVGHRTDDPYWRFPNDFQKKFDKVNAEKACMEKAKEIASQSKFGEGIANYKNLSDKTKLIHKGMVVYIPFSIEDIEKQATVLDQCLVRNGYIEKMAKRESILLFVKTLDGKRLATAEIDWKKNLLQIYGHEYGQNRDKSAATKEEKEAVTEFIHLAKLRKPAESKISKLEKKGLFFKGVTKSLKDKYGKNTYKPGTILSTGCPDYKFNEQCVSTDKAIHFCKDPNKISHFFPESDKYLVILPLGKVCHRGDEYISNRIKVVSVLTV